MERKDEKFILVDVESLSLDDEILKYEPKKRGTIGKINCTKKLIKRAIKDGTKNFYMPVCDPSFIGESSKISFKAGEMPARGRSFNWWWEYAAKMYAPEHGSRLGTRNEYYAFLGVLIKKLVDSGTTIEDAWYAVCVDSKDIGHYKDSNNAKHYEYEYTGAREICGFCDLANVHKLLSWDDKNEVYWIAGGSIYNKGSEYPLAYSYADNCYCRIGNNNAVGWVVLEK